MMLNNGRSDNYPVNVYPLVTDEGIPEPLEQVFEILVACEIVFAAEQIEKREFMQQRVDRRCRGQYMHQC